MSLCSSSSPVLLSLVFIHRSRQKRRSAHSPGSSSVKSYSSSESLGLSSLFLSKMTSRHPSVSNAQSRRCPFSFLSDWTVMKALSPTWSFNLFSYDARPPSVHTTTFDMPNFSRSLSSRGLRVVVSAVSPGLMQNARGMPSLSVNSPIWTIGLGRLSLECPYCLRPRSSSVSK